MDVPQTYIIIQNPDGSVEIGTQPQFINKKLMGCYNCQKKIVFSETAKMVKCPLCGKTNGVPQMKKTKFGQCRHCNLITAFHPEQNTVSCPQCGNVIQQG